MTLPFTVRDFLDLFGRYNSGIWPAQLVLYGVAALIVILAVRQERPRLVPVLLATLWLWSGLVYHLTFFSAINPVAPLFGIVFLAQAGILLWDARGRTAGPPAAHASFAVPAGKALVAYALIGYPLIGYLAGHHYPETPTFGAPCPTVIFTLGVLLWTRRELSWWLVAIPLVWTVVGTSAAVQLRVPQDYGLTIAGVATVLALAAGTRRLETLRPVTK
jgi:uncharacterized membrane protein (UPF0136 family)